MPEKRFVEHIQLELKNIACFREFLIDLHSGQVTEVTGGNGRGKTTLLRMLRTTTSGGKCQVPPRQVTDFEERGLAKAKIDDVTVCRELRYGETATELTVLNGFGDPVKSPATVLRQWFGDGSYLDPIAIVDMRPEDRAKAIATALEVSPATASTLLSNITGRTWTITCREDIFPSIQQAHDSLYELRRQKRADAEAADAQADGVISFLPVEWRDANDESAIPSAPVKPEPLGDIYDRKRAAEVRNAERERVGQEIAELETLIRQHEETIATHALSASRIDGDLMAMGALEDEAAIEEQIRRLQQQLAEMRDRNMRRRQLYLQADGARKSAESLREALAVHQQRLTAKQERERELGGEEDVSQLQARIDAHEEAMAHYSQALEVHGDLYSRWRQTDALRARAKDLWTEWEALDSKVKALDRLPIQLLENIPLPIPGMVVSGKDIFLPDGDTLRGFDDFGDADRYRFAARLAMELSTVNILILDGVEKCDADRRLELYRMAAEAGFIVFSTRVTGGPLTTLHLGLDDLTPASEDQQSLD